MYVDEIFTFPAHDPPNMDAIHARLSILPNIPPVYDGEAISVDLHWTLLIRGPVTKAMHTEIGASLKVAYGFLEQMVADLSFMLAGWEMHVDQNSE